MADPFRSRVAPSLADLSPIAMLFGGLFVVWCAAAFWLSSLVGVVEWVRQVVPLLIWVGAIAFYLAWQRPPQPGHWVGLLPVSPERLLLTVATFAVIFGWHYVRTLTGRPPSGFLWQLPPEIFAWMIAGIFVNELLFHGVLQTRLRELTSSRVAVFVTALVMVLFRLPSFFVGAGPASIDAGVLVTILFLALIGGTLRDRSGSLWPAIALAAGNALGTLI